MKKILLIYIIILSIVNEAKSKVDNNFKKGKFELAFSFAFIPVNLEKSKIDFRYIDGNPNSKYLIDTINANFQTQENEYNSCLSLGVNYYFSNNLKISLQAKPHLNSFLSNESKNGKVYGVQFDLSMIYDQKIVDKLFLPLQFKLSKIISGFGITSSGPLKKDIY